MKKLIMVSLAGAIALFATPALAIGLLDSVPEPIDNKSADWEFIQDGGKHAHFRASEPAQEAAKQYRVALEASGWSIVDFHADGSSYGSNGRVIATRDGRFLTFLSNGPGKSAYIDLCVWPEKPDDRDC